MDSQIRNRVAPLWVAVECELISPSEFRSALDTVIGSLDQCPADIAELAMAKPRYGFELRKLLQAFMGKLIDDGDYVLHAISRAVDDDVITIGQLPLVCDRLFLDDEYGVMNSPNDTINSLHDSHMNGSLDREQYCTDLARTLAALE